MMTHLDEFEIEPIENLWEVQYLEEFPSTKQHRCLIQLIVAESLKDAKRMFKKWWKQNLKTKEKIELSFLEVKRPDVIWKKEKGN